MESYQRVEKPRVQEPANPGVVKLTTKGKKITYISYALRLLNEQKGRKVILKAMGRAITNAVTVAEILKRRVVGLHQITDISESTFDDVYEPLVEGLKVGPRGPLSISVRTERF